MLPDGDFALQRSDEAEEPLLLIRFSGEARELLQDASMDVARAMIDAGIDALEQARLEEGDFGDDEPLSEPTVLH